MKDIKYLLKLIGVLMFTVVIFNSCEKEEEYDFSSIIPKIFEMDGQVNGVVRTQTLEYSVFPRGGSTFEWLVTGAEVQPIDGVSNRVNIYYNQSDDPVEIKVIETTLGGVSSEPFITSVVVGPFCPLDMSLFVGAFNCDEEGYGVYGVNLTQDVDNPNRVYNDNFWDWAADGEVIYYEFDGSLDQIISIPDQPFVFGDGTAGSVSGSGTYDGCSGTFVCDYDVVYGGDTYPTHHEFSAR